MTASKDDFQKLQNENDQLKARIKELEREQSKFYAPAKDINSIITEHVNDILWSSDNDFHLTFMSPNVERVLGYKPSELLGTTPFTYLTNDSRKKAKALISLRNERDSQGVFDMLNRVEVDCYDTDKNIHCVEVITRAQFNDHGERIGYDGILRNITEQKRAQKKLYESERRYRGLFETATLGIFIADTKNNILDCNDQAAKTLGYTRSELLGLNAGDIVVSPNSPSPKEVITRCQNGETCKLERTYKRKDGSLVEVEAFVRSLSRGTHHIMFSDITDRKKAERDLSMFKLLMRDMTDNMIDMLWAKDLDGRYMFANKAMRNELLHCDEVDPIGKTDVFFAERQRTLGHTHTFGECCFNTDEIVIKAEAPGRFLEDGLVQGEYLALDVQKSPLYNDKDEFVGTVGTARDITTQLKDQQALKDNAKYLKSILDASNDVFWEYDLSSGLASQVEGIRDEQAPSTFVAQPDNLETLTFLHPSDIPALKRALSDLKAGKITELTTEARLKKKNGDWKWIYNRGKVVEHDENGTPTKVFGAYTDISDLKKTQEQLEIARDAAEQASRSKSEFLANMSHELRTPLNGIFGMLQLCLATELTEEQKDYMETALSTGKNLLAVINDVLDFSKMEAGLMTFNHEPFDIRHSIQVVMDTFTVPAEEKRLSLTTTIHSGIAKVVRGDDARLRQILFNLVGNSVKFSEAGTVVVEVSPLTHPRKDGKDLLLFIIRDSGIGIPTDQMQHVFEAFTQVDGAYTRRYKGTGLGLGIVKRLVHNMGGTLHVSSEPNVGTEVAFTLPLQTAQNQLSAQGMDSAAIAPPPRPKSILVVEDEAVNQLAAKMLLKKMGHTVVCTSNGKEAIETLKNNSFDCILMDVQMPIQDGVETTRIIRSGVHTEIPANIPIVAMTAHAMLGDREKFLAAGMTSYLSKPLVVELLQEKLAEL